MNPPAPSPSDSSIAQAFREMCEESPEAGVIAPAQARVADWINNRAREIDASAPAAAVGGEDAARKLYEPDDYADAFKGRATPAAQSSPHTTEDDYQHFLAYSGLEHTPILQYAYYHGADVGMEKPKDAAQPSAKDGVRGDSEFDPAEMRVVADDLDKLAVDGWLCAKVGADFIRHIVTPVEPKATTSAGLVEWRWVDEKGRAMTNWKQGEPPPMREVSDGKGTMRVEVREAATGREVTK